MPSILYSMMMLAFESSSVIALRLAKISLGGEASRVESRLMIDEKINAGVETLVGMMTGTTALGAISRYRDHVAANQLRLSAH